MCCFLCSYVQYIYMYIVLCLLVPTCLYTACIQSASVQCLFVCFFLSLFFQAHPTPLITVSLSHIGCDIFRSMFFFSLFVFLLSCLEAEGSSDTGRQDDSENDTADNDHDLLLQGGETPTDLSIQQRITQNWTCSVTKSKHANIYGLK